MVEHFEGSYGGFRDIRDRPFGDWLTREEAVHEYGALSNLLHRNLKAYFGEPANLSQLYRRCSNLEFKVHNLLSHHRITVLDEKTRYYILMTTTGLEDNGESLEDRIQVAATTLDLVPEC